MQTLLAASSFQPPRQDVNPFLYQSAISPHIAAQIEGCPIDFHVIIAAKNRLAVQADLLLIEGIGGFCAPLSAHLNSTDLALALNHPILLVVGMRLGCLNHALLTAEAIAARGLHRIGWIGNHVDLHMSHQAENMHYLQERLLHDFGMPCLGTVPYITAPAGPAYEMQLNAAAKTLRLPGVGQDCNLI